MSTVYFFGDSFSAAHKNARDQEKTWWYNLAKKLGGTGFLNLSMIGSSQEYSFYMIASKINDITPDDQIIITLTHPSRRWWVASDPTLGKPEIVKEANHVDPQIGKTAELWQRYVQNEYLDVIATVQRLGWLSRLVSKRNWRKPIVLFCFDQLVPGIEDFDNIIFSRGSLTENISTPEVPGGHSRNNYNNLLKGVDFRYNHLCLTNHAILTDKVYNTITKNDELNLTTGFRKNLLTLEVLEDQEFINKELDPLMVKARYEKIKERSLSLMFRKVMNKPE